MRLNFANMFAEFVAANEKKWAHDRAKSVGASEIFGCLRKAWFLKRGPEFTEQVQIGTEVKQIGTEEFEGEQVPMYGDVAVFETKPKYPTDDDESSWGASQRGNLLEAHFVVPTIRDHLPKGKLLWGGDDQKTLFHNFNSATPDGLIIGLDRDALADYGIEDIGSNEIVIEIKTIDPRVRLDEEKAIHGGQARTQLGIIREKTPYKPNYAVILYVDASFLDKIHVFVIEYDAPVWQEAQDRATTVFTTDDPAHIPPEGKLDNECEYCPFTRSCAKVTCGSIPEDNAAEAAKNEAILLTFDELTDKYKLDKNAFDVADKEFKKTKQDIKEALVDADTRKVGGKKSKRPWSVSWSGQAGARRLDQSLLRNALGPDLDPFKTTGDSFDVLRVTFSNDGEDNA